MKNFFRVLLISILSLTYFILPANVDKAQAVFGEIMEGYTPVLLNTTMPIAYTGSSNRRITGVLFTASGTYIPSGASAYLRKYGTPGTSYTIGIKAVSGGYPTGDYLAYADLNGNDLTTSYELQVYSFDESTILESGTQYALTIESTSDGDDSNYVSWAGDTGSPDASHPYVYDTSPASLWVTNLYSATTIGLGWHVYGLTGVPPIVSTFDMVRVEETVLQGWAGSTDGNILESGFDWGTESGNYTDEYTTEGLPLTSYFFQVTPNNLDYGETYYFRAKARNIDGWGYGSEKSFTNTPVDITVTLSDAYVDQSETSDNFTAAFAVLVEPVGASENVSALMSTSLSPFSDDVDLRLVSVGSGLWTFQTKDDDNDNEFILQPDTTYYYKAWATTSDAINHYSEIKSFTTANATTPDRPSVKIIKFVDVSSLYNKDYVYELTSKITTTENTSDVLYYGMRFSDHATSAALIDPMQELGYNLSNGIYSMTLDFSNATWYDGETIYFQAVIGTEAYGDILSPLFSYRPNSGLPDITGGAGDGTTGGTIPEIQKTLARVRYQWGLTGIMGSWAFMALILLIISMLFGVAMFSTDSGKIRAGIGISWALISIAVVGAFIFSGELGVWPIIILVAATVLLIMTIVGLRLSGGGE